MMGSRGLSQGDCGYSDPTTGDWIALDCIPNTTGPSGPCTPGTPNCGDISTSPSVWGTTPSTTPSTSGSNVGFWAQLAAQLAKGWSQVGTTRYSVPQLNPGQYIQSGPGGTVMYQQPTTGGSAFPTSLSGSMGSMLPILLIGGVLMIVMMSKK